MKIYLKKYISKNEKKKEKEEKFFTRRTAEIIDDERSNSTWIFLNFRHELFELDTC